MLKKTTPAMTNYVGIYETLCRLQGSVKYTSMETGQTNWKIGNLELATTPTGQVVCLVNFNIGPCKKFVVTNQIKGVIFNNTTPRCTINLSNGDNINWTAKINGRNLNLNPPADITHFAALLEDLKKERKRDKRPNTSAQLSLMSPQPKAYSPIKQMPSQLLLRSSDLDPLITNDLQSPGLRNSQDNHQVNTTPRACAPPAIPRTITVYTPQKPSTVYTPQKLSTPKTTEKSSPNPMMTPSHVKATRGLLKVEPKKKWETQEEESAGSDEAMVDLSGLIFTDVPGEVDKENKHGNNNRIPKGGGASRGKSALAMRKEEGGSLFMSSFQEKQQELEERKENTAPKPVSGVKGFYSRGRQAAGYMATDALLQPRQTNINITTCIKRTPGFLSVSQPKKPCLGNNYMGWSHRNVPSTAIKTSQLALQGFSNLGNTCYMNSILQSLFSLDQFAMDILNGSLLSHMQKDNLYKALASLLFAKQRNQSPDQVETQLQRVKQAICSTATRFSGFMQQDAQEFLCQCLDQLKDDWDKARQRLQDTPPDDTTQREGEKDLKDAHPCPVVKNFEFEVMHSIVCKQCGEVITKAEQFYDLSLDMPTRSSSNPIGSMQTALEQFFRAEVIEYACSQCNSRQATVTHTFTRLPRVIIIHLKRYRFDTDAVQNAKLRRRILIPKYLCLHYHCSKATEGPTSKSTSLINGAPSPQRPLSGDRGLRPVMGLTDGNALTASQSGNPSRFNFASRKRLEYNGSNTGKQQKQAILLDSVPNSDNDETHRVLEMSKKEAEKVELEKEKRRKQEEEEIKKAMEQSKQDADCSITEMTEEQQLAYVLAISTQDISTLQATQRPTTPCLSEDIPDIPQEIRNERNVSEDIDKEEFVSLKRRGTSEAYQALDNALSQVNHIGVDSHKNGTPNKRFKGDGLVSNQSTPFENAQCTGDSAVDLTSDAQGLEGNRTKPRRWLDVKHSIFNLFSPVKQTPNDQNTSHDSDLIATPLSTVKPNLVQATVLDITKEEDHSTLQLGVNGEAKPSYKELKAKEDEELRRATELSLQDAQEIAKKEEDALKQAKQISLQEFSESFTCLEDEDDTVEPMEIEEESDDDVTKELTKNAETGHLPLSYRLTSIVSHIGSTSSVGHYISDVFDSKKSSWLKYDDSQVNCITESAVREERERTGYIFFYRAK